MNIRNHIFGEHRTRSLIKAITFRILVVILDLYIYLLED